MTDEGPLPDADPTKEKALVPLKLAGRSLIEIWTEGAAGAEDAERRLETFTRMLKTLRRHAIGQTYAEDWVIHATTDRDGNVLQQVGYLQDVGAQRAGKIFGVEMHEPKVSQEVQPDKSYIYVFTAAAFSRVTHEFIDYVEGSRWSGDDFFMRAIERAIANGEEPPKLNPTDVRKAAYANLHGRAVRALAGLSAVPLDELKDAGVEVDRCRFVGYAAGSKGGTSAGAGTGTAELTMRFGRSKGKKVSELEDRDLAWYVSAYQRDIADPAKSQHLQANQRILDRLVQVQEQRARAKETGETAAGAPAPASAAAAGGGGEAASGEDKSTPATRKRGQLWDHVQEACTSAAVPKGQALPTLRQVVKDQLGLDIKGLSDLTDEEVINQLIAIPRGIYVQVAKALVKK